MANVKGYDKDKEKYRSVDPLGFSDFDKEYKTVDEEKISRQFSKLEEELYRMKKEREKIIVARQAMPRLEEEPIEELRIKSEKVIGNIFDRVRFLEARIKEIDDNIELRGKLHEAIEKEIDIDIAEKGRLAEAISDSNERRNLKLDVSVLRKEKRHESVQFWKDVMELTLELRELKEEYETEKKIAGLFAGSMDLSGG